MNRRTFFEAALAAVGSLPLLSSLVPKPKARHENFKLTVTGLTTELLEAGEFIPRGAAVYVGDDKKVRLATNAGIDSEGNPITYRVRDASLEERDPYVDQQAIAAWLRSHGYHPRK